MFSRGLAEFTDHQTSWNDALQMKILLKVATLQNNYKPHSTPAAILNGYKNSA